MNFLPSREVHPSSRLAPARATAMHPSSPRNRSTRSVSRSLPSSGRHRRRHHSRVSSDVVWIVSAVSFAMRSAPLYRPSVSHRLISRRSCFDCSLRLFSINSLSSVSRRALSSFVNLSSTIGVQPGPARPVATVRPDPSDRPFRSQRRTGADTDRDTSRRRG